MNEVTFISSDHFVELCLPVFVGLALRSAVTLQQYSGKGKPPLFGDYEAQRHWMEITTNLPISQWYFNTSDNDLEYWGLDYPPLTAYHSWIMGKISEQINPAWTKLHSSRGFESEDHKLFMRYSVLCVDVLIFLPSVVYFLYSASHSHLGSTITPFFSACLMLMYPGLILIDNGHFQYNCVSLGLFIWALAFVLQDHDIKGTMIFCLSLSYKQMELYHALPFFFYFLGKCLNASLRSGLVYLTKLASAVLFMFLLVFFPFLGSQSTLFQVFYRMFPFIRGLYEDKVSNFWCITSPLVKWRILFSNGQLIMLCIAFVLLSCGPVCLSLLVKPTKKKLLYSCTICALSFYLFSFQVHEKSVLLVAIPALCLLHLTPLSSFLFSISSTFSMWHLFRKDGLCFSCMCLTFIFVYFGCVVIFRRSIKSVNAYSKCLVASIFFVYITLVLCDIFIQPPKKYPDIFPLLFSAYSFVNFFGFLIFWNYEYFKA